MTMRTLTIQGMHCQNCVKRLAEAFSKVPGVSSAHVTLSPPEAHLTTTGDVPLAALQSAASEAGAYTVTNAAPTEAPAAHATPDTAPAEKKPSLYPLALIVSYIAGAVLLAGWAKAGWGVPDWRVLMLDFMAGFFLVFSFFKLLDLRGFADAYQSYDILAQRSRAYAFVYPFLELALGVGYLLRWQLTAVNAATLALMLIGAIGVLRAVLDKRRIRCAFLGTALNLPMTTVTLVEDLGMALMAAAALAWTH
ncbi:MAG: heavy-metal-associated domain-containing protein [Phycisphaerales bacterium]